MIRTSAMGDYLRYQSAFPPHLSEFIILVASRLWSQQYEWSLHSPIALKAGVDPEIVDAIAQGRRPAPMSEEQEILYDFSTELIESGSVSDNTYYRALAKFGEKGIVDAAGITGYYTFLAMILNTARTSPEPGRTSAASRSPGQDRWIDRPFARLRHAVIRRAHGRSRRRAHQFPLAFPLLTGGHACSSSWPCTFLLLPHRGHDSADVEHRERHKSGNSISLTCVPSTLRRAPRLAAG